MNPESGQWLDPATLDFLIWAYSTRYYEPDVVTEENVPAFAVDTTFDIFNDFSEDVIKHKKVRSSCPIAKRSYGMMHKVFSPTDLGVPSERSRLYASFVLQPYQKEIEVLSFEDLFFRKLSCNCSIIESSPLLPTPRQS